MSLDNFKKQTITWDMINQAFEHPIQIMEGDVNARTLLLKITDNGSVLDLTGYSVKLTYKYMYKSQSGFIMLTPSDISKEEFTLIIPTEMTGSGLIKSNLILINESLEQVIVSKNLTFMSDNSTVTDLSQEVNNKIDDFTKLLLENMPQVMRSELNDLHAQTESNTSNIELKANSADMTSLQNAMTNLQNEVEAFGITPENLVTIKSLLDAIASNASESEVVELINSVNVLTSNISLMSNGDYSPKANQTDLESLQSIVNNQSATISIKANQTDLNNLQSTVNNQSATISTKAEQSDLLTTNQNVTTAQATANQAEIDAQTAMTKANESQANSLPLNGNAVSSSKLATARKLQVSLQASTPQSFDGASDVTNIGVTGLLPIANGGTGASTRPVAFNNLAFLGLNPSLVANGTDKILDTVANWKTIGTGYAIFNNADTKLNGFPSSVIAGTTVYIFNYVYQDEVYQEALTNTGVKFTRTKSNWTKWLRISDSNVPIPVFSSDTSSSGIFYTINDSTLPTSSIVIGFTFKFKPTITSTVQTATLAINGGMAYPFAKANSYTGDKVALSASNAPVNFLKANGVYTLTFTGSQFAISEETLTDVQSLSGTVPIANGGTGATTITGLVKGNGTGAMTAAVMGTDYAQAHPVGAVITNTSSSSSGYTTGIWINIGSTTIGSITVYYWNRTA